MSRTTHDPRDPYFARNTLGISCPEAFWGLALPVVIESTFLQIFLKTLGATNMIIGIFPAVFSSGLAVFSVLSSYLTAHLVRKRRAVITAHIISSLPLFVFGVLLPHMNVASRLPLFVFCYVVFSFTMGITVPLWQNFIVKIFSDRNAIRAISVMMVTQLVARLVGSFFIFSIVERYSFTIPGSSAVFMATGFVFFIGSFFFLFVREIAVKGHGRENAHTMRTLLMSLREIVENKNYIRFFFSGVEVTATITVISFYANYAVEWNNIPRHIAAGLFLIVLFCGSIIGNIVFGWFNLLSLKGKFIASKGTSFIAVIILLFARGIPGFLTVSFLLGAARGINQLVYSPTVKLLSGKEDATDYFSMTQILGLPLIFGIPFLSGVVIDCLEPFGALAYRITFIMLLCVSSAGIWLIMKTDFSKSRK
jgi:MFS family permease